MKKYVLILLAALLLLSGCTADPDTGTPPTEGQSESSNPNHTEASDESKDTVMFIVYSWDDEKNMWENAEYSLSEEQSAFVRGLFYNHEKEILDSPVDSVGLVEFRIGEDHLSTSMEGADLLDGVIDGEQVLVELSESEAEMMYRIISAYATDIP